MKGRALCAVSVTGMAGSWLADYLAYLPVPGWAQALVGGGTLAVFVMSVLAFITCAAWNLASVIAEGPQGRRAGAPEPGDGPPAAGAKGDGGLARAPLSPSAAAALLALQRACRSGTAPVSGLRYLGPPPVVTGPHRVVSGTGTLWAQGSPGMSSGRCGKCGELMARHSYYGRDACIASRAAYGTDGLCDSCGRPASRLTAVTVPGRAGPAYVCGSCA